MNSKNKMPVWIVVLLLIAILAFICIASYNGMVGKQEKVESASADIDTQLQRRADLIPNLVNSVKGYMEHESSIITAITESRKKLVSAETMEEKAEANDALTQALGNFNVIVENYPDLKANTTFVQLQDELAGTENRIATSRRDYNEAVRDYNQTIKRFPGRLFASLFGFEPADYFTAKEGSEDAPDIQF